MKGGRLMRSGERRYDTGRAFRVFFTNRMDLQGWNVKSRIFGISFSIVFLGKTESSPRNGRSFLSVFSFSYLFYFSYIKREM